MSPEPDRSEAGSDEPKSRPATLDLDRTRGLTILWEDGVESVIPLETLRRACPCAECRAARETKKAPQTTGLPILGSPIRPDDQVTVDSAELVGHYALRIRWRDGHDTGIYEFTLLRSLGQPERT